MTTTSDQDPPAEGDDLESQVARLRAERDAARAELAALRGGAGAGDGTPAHSRHVVRRVVAVVLVVISCITFLTGGVGIWASRNLLDTDVWLSRVGPLIEDPAVQDALARQITAEVMTLVDPQALFTEVLPERGQLLAVPLAGAVEGFVGDQVSNFVASDAFERLWVEVNRQAHAAAVRVLRDESEAITAGDRTVTLNLVPVINRVLQRLTSISPEILGRTVDLPDVQIDEVPTEAIRTINERLGTDLPEDFGQIVIYDQGKLKEVQDAVALFDRVVTASVVLFVLSTIGALATSVDRRRTLLQLAVADVLILVLLRRGAMRAQEQVLDLVRVRENRGAVRATTDALFQGLFDGTRILLWGLGIVIVVALVAGGGRRAVAFRRKVAAVAAGLVGAARDRTTDPATVAWMADHKDLLQFATAAVGIVLLWWLNLSWIGVLVVVAAVVAIVVLLGRLRPHATA